MKRLRGQEGFTLIELVIIILVLGILAATAIPKFYDLASKARLAAEKGVVGAVRGGIAIGYASNLVNGVTTYPPLLGGGPGAAGAANPLFSNVISPGIDADWTKSATGEVFWSSADGTYTYSSANETFQ